MLLNLSSGLLYVVSSLITLHWGAAPVPSPRRTRGLYHIQIPARPGLERLLSATAARERDAYPDEVFYLSDL